MTRLRLTGELQDSHVARGLYYPRARYYDPALACSSGRGLFLWVTFSLPTLMQRIRY
jgi:hypothetical protein